MSDPLQLVGFFSYKGGVGRTLILCNTALALVQQLRARNNNTSIPIVCVDLDLAAPGILPIFGLSQRAPGFLSQLLSNAIIQRPLQSISTQLKLPRQNPPLQGDQEEVIPLHIIANEQPERHSIQQLNELLSQETSAGRLRGIIQGLREKVEGDLFAKYIFLDLASGWSGISPHIFPLLQHLVIVTRGDRQHRKALADFLTSNDFLRRADNTNVLIFINQLPLSWLAQQSPELETYLVETGLKEFWWKGKVVIAPVVEAALVDEPIFFPQQWSYDTDKKRTQNIREPVQKDEEQFQIAAWTVATKLMEGAQ